MSDGQSSNFRIFDRSTEVHRTSKVEHPNFTQVRTSDIAIFQNFNGHRRSTIGTSQLFEHRASELLNCSNIEHPNYLLVRTSSIRILQHSLEILFEELFFGHYYGVELIGVSQKMPRGKNLPFTCIRNSAQRIAVSETLAACGNATTKNILTQVGQICAYKSPLSSLSHHSFRSFGCFWGWIYTQ